VLIDNSSVLVPEASIMESGAPPRWPASERFLLRPWRKPAAILILPRDVDLDLIALKTTAAQTFANGT
jgi:hypothetical protein